MGRNSGSLLLSTIRFWIQLHKHKADQAPAITPYERYCRFMCLAFFPLFFAVLIVNGWMGGA